MIIFLTQILATFWFYIGKKEIENGWIDRKLYPLQADGTEYGYCIDDHKNCKA